MKIFKSFIIITSLFLCSIFLTQCATYDFSKPVVQQGNLLPESLLNRLRLGMSKNDVAILLGSSLLEPSFTYDRWDYAYSLRKRDSLVIKRHVSLFFKNDKLTVIQKH